MESTITPVSAQANSYRSRVLALRPRRWKAAHSMAGKGGLSERERAILDFEGSWWKVATTKEQLIRERFHISPEQYHTKLLKLIRDEAAFLYHPFVVQRLRRETKHHVSRASQKSVEYRQEGQK